MDAHDADELVSYRSLSSLAIVALVLGVLSPLVLMVPLLYVVPLAGILVAYLAITNIRSHEGTLTGLSLAQVGLFLCLFSLMASSAKTFVRTKLYEQQATLAARQWLDSLVEEDLSAAIDQLSPNAVVGLTRPENPARAPTDNSSAVASAPNAIEALAQDPFVEQVRQLSQQGTAGLKIVSLEVDDNSKRPTVIIDFLPEKSVDSISLVVHCTRGLRPNQEVRWQIESWRLVDVPQHRH